MGEKRVERIKTGPQHAFDVVHGVKQFRVGLDLPPRENLDGSGNADPRLVVAVDIGAHVQFELVLLGIQQLADLLGVADRIDATRNGAGDWTSLYPLAVGAHKHLRRCRYQKFAFA